ncbi:MAG: hypothetical protein ABW171_04055 [Steroidobacter sp.]
MRSRVLLLVLSMFASWSVSADAARARSFNEVVEGRLRPQLERLLVQLAKDGRDMRIDGVSVFNGSDKFLPGKIALGWSDLIASLPAGDPRIPRYLEDFGHIAKLTVDDANDSWGIYYYLSALASLERAGRLKGTIDPLTLAKLRVRLDWRSFVDVDSYALIDHPNNYYCVAFAIARLRHKLGWEDDKGAQRLYAAMTNHYREHSGPYGFADETDGEGRFDRYSVLLAAEIAQRFIETGDQPPQEIIGWLRKSIDVMMIRLSSRGEGFEYGRSLGPYADTSVVEVMTAAAQLGLLTDEQKLLAYAFASRAAERYVDFWIDSATGSVNLWDDGRRTDRYRGKFRVLGENLSLGHQFIYTNAAWNGIGFRNRAPMPNFKAALASLPQRAVTWFARGEYDRLVVTWREGDRIIALPLINGGASQHDHSPYFPIPFANGLLSGAADDDNPLLLPRFTLADGSTLMPLAYFRDVKVEEKGGRTTISYRQSELDRMGGDSPVKDDRLTLRTTYTFERGLITRTDVYTPARKLAVKGIDLAFGSFSANPSTNGLTTRFGNGAVEEFSIKGLDRCESASAAGDTRYQAPYGPMASKVVCSSAAFDFESPLTLSWRIKYRPE